MATVVPLKPGVVAANANRDGWAFCGAAQFGGLITREVDGEIKSHRLIRADRFPSLDDATETTIRNARQMIDEQGDRLFG